jgi:ABC transport system ATP-binding/permease protein
MNFQNGTPDASSIQFLSGPLAGKALHLHKPVMQIGRDNSNDIVIFDPKVSRFHARLIWSNGVWSIENLSQKSVVTVDQNRVQRSALQHNSKVILGDDTSFVFLINSPASPFANPPAVVAAPPQVPQGIAAQPTPFPPASPSPAMPPVQPSTPMPFVDRTAIAGMPVLEVSSNVHRDKQSHHLLKPVINIGRNPGNDIVINEPVVSGFHAQIVREGNEWVLVHPHPSRGQTLNGLMYQGRTVAGNEQFRKPLLHGDIFRIGDDHGTLVTLSYGDGSGASQEVPPEVHPIPLNTPMITLGRLPDNTVVLNHPQVSGHHARMEQGQGGYRIVDLNSTNHIYINGQLVSGVQMLKTGDEIRIGPYRLTYTGTQLTQYDESSSIRIDAMDLKKVGNNNVVLLNDISLVIPPRKFVALVGGSGAGKSTLMDALNGLRPAQKGTVLYNGQDYYNNLAAFSTQLGYVPQDDIVHRELTVERALYYAGRMRLPGDFTEAQIMQRIAEVLEDVEMTERRKLLVNKLSGGQRKRVSIALELLANPSAFFLDEPTSGLDPGLDRKMMFLLRRLADRGRTIILVTHATNNINACDYVCFLAQGGKLAFFGPPNDAKAFFNKTDFAEIYSALEPTKENPNIPQEAETRFKSSPEYYTYVVSPINEGHAKRVTEQQAALQAVKRPKRGNPWQQFFLLSMRYLELLRNDFGNLAILLLQAPVIALLLTVMVRYQIGANVFDANQIVQCRTQIIASGAPLALPSARQTDTIDCDKVIDFLRNDPQGKSFVQKKGGENQALQDFLLPGPGADAQKVLFIMAFATVLFGCINGAREIVKEAPIYRRERAVNLGIMPYMFSKIVVLGLLCLFQSAVLVLIVNIGIPLKQGVILPIIPEVYVTLALTSLAGLMIGLTVSAIAPNNDRAISFVPIILIPQVIFSGAIIPLKDYFTQIVATVFPTRWAMAALGSSLGLHADKIGGDRLFGDDPTYHGTLFSIYTHADAANRIMLSWAALGAITIVLAIMIGIFLKRKDVRT